MPQDKWPTIEKALRKIGVSKDMLWRVKEAREYLVAMSSSGAPVLPDFTLHNHTHSDNIILLLARLKSIFEFELNEHEAYVLATSAYVHDLGMFFSEERFRREILPNPGQTLHTCPQNRCDRIENYRLQGKKIGEQIREVHNLLSIVMVQKDTNVRSAVESDDLAYLIAVCRGHRKANLREQGCRCYQTEPLRGDVIRVGLLAALLRLADALDLYSDRAPKQVFKQRAPDFLNNPSALEHWLKHYFVTDPYVARQDHSGNISLVCTVNFRVPIKQIGGESYLNFFRPLFEKYITEMNGEDLDINKYPPVFTEALHIAAMQATLAEGQGDGFRDLPTDIARSIEESGCKDALAFLQWLRPHSGKVDVVFSPGEPSVTYEVSALEPDVYASYEVGLHQLMSQVRQDDPQYSKTLVYQQRLIENITQSRQYGDTETRRAERAEVVNRLNELTLSVLGISFSELCRSKVPTPKQEPSEHYDNPFYHRDAIKDQDYFFGREKETRKILAAVKRGQCVSIVGPRHIGKTSLLFHIADKRVLTEHGLEPDKFVMVYCTGQGLTSDRQDDLQGYFLGKIHSQVPSSIACNRLDEMIEHATQRGLTVVLLLDEFELFAVNSGGGGSFFHNLQALRSQYALTLVSSSHTSLRELSCHDESSLPHNFFQMFHPLELGLFSPQEARSLIGLSQRAGITFSEPTIEFILDAAGLHPFFLQIACDHIFERQSTKVQLDASDYESLRQEIDSELESHSRYYWSTLDRVQQSVLVNLEAMQTDSDHAQPLKELERLGLVARQGNVYDYISTSFKDFVRKHQAVLFLNQENKSLIGRMLGSARIVEEIGSGGMATVYKAYQPLLDRDVAVKVLARDVQREGFLQRFKREAQAVARLRHPNILSIHDFGVEDDLAYIIMDYVPGGTLADRIRDGLQLKEAVEIAIQVGDALHYAHRQGIVHRDVKPANILIDTNGSPLLTDFGLVKFLTASEQFTKYGTGMMGTADYMAPEQVCGEEVDARSDVYALGTVLYKMVTGRLPFEAGNGMMVLKKLQEPPLSPRQLNPSLPIEVEQVTLKAIASEPENRYQSALEMVEALRSVQLDP